MDPREYLPESVTQVTSAVSGMASGTVAALVRYFDQGTEPKQNWLKAIRNHNYEGFQAKLARLEWQTLSFDPSENPLFVACAEAIAQKNNPEARVACMEIINHILDDEGLNKKFNYTPVMLSENKHYQHLVHMALAGEDFELASHFINRDFEFKNHELMYGFALMQDNEEIPIFLMAMGYPLLKRRILSNAVAHNSRSHMLVTSHNVLMEALHLQRYEVARQCLILLEPADRKLLEAFYHNQTPMDFVIYWLMHHLSLYSATQANEVLHHVHGLFSVFTMMLEQDHTVIETPAKNFVYNHFHCLAFLIYLLHSKGLSTDLSFMTLKAEQQHLDMVWGALVGTELMDMPKDFDETRQKQIKHYAEVLPLITLKQFNFSAEDIGKLSHDQLDTLNSMQEALKCSRIKSRLMDVYTRATPFKRVATDLGHKIMQLDAPPDSPNLRK